jgi:hypothetical protein
MDTDVKDVSSDRAALIYEIGIADGIFGDKMNVVATEEGLEFGDGYSMIPWAWIERAATVLNAAYKPSPEGLCAHTPCREAGVAT